MRGERDYLDQAPDLDPLTLDGRPRRTLRSRLRRLRAAGALLLTLLAFADQVRVVREWAKGLGWWVVLGILVALGAWSAREELWDGARRAWLGGRERIRTARAEAYI